MTADTGNGMDHWIRKMCKISILPGLLLPFLMSCHKDEVKFPIPTVDFQTDPVIVEVGKPVMFENLTINADNYQWDFGDGQTSTAISPTITYDASDTYSVKLVAFTKDNQKDSAVQEIYVGQRVLKAISINSIAFYNDKGEDWDDAGSGPDSTKLPDFTVVLGPQNDLNVGIATPILQDLAQFELPIGFQLNPGGDPFILTPETWDMTFLDFDGTDIDNPKNSDFEIMADITFNPVSVSTSAVDENGDGFIQVSVGPYSVDLIIKVE